MPYVSPAAIVTGTTISKTTFGDVVKADLDYLANPPACRVYNTAQSIPTGTETTLTFASERFDTAAMHSTTVNTSRITFPHAGIYLVGFALDLASSTVGQRYALMKLNGTTVIGTDTRLPTGSGWASWVISTVYKVAANDYAEVFVWQNSGGALAADAADFYATWIGLG